MLSWSIIVWTSEHFYIELNIDIMPTYNWTFYIKYQRLDIWDFVTKVLVLDNHHEHFSTSTVNILMIKSYSLCIHIIEFKIKYWTLKSKTPIFISPNFVGLTTTIHRTSFKATYSSVNPTLASSPFQRFILHYLPRPDGDWWDRILLNARAKRPL